MTEKIKTEVTPSYGMRKIGGWGIRGWRVHCDCSFLSHLYINKRTVAQAAQDHRDQHKLGLI